MKSLRVCLINPPILSVMEPWYDTPDFVRTGLACLAGYLRQFPDFEIIVIDSKYERLNFEEVRERVRAFQPDVVGLTAFTNEIKPAAYLAAHIKNDIKNVVTLIGGVHVTAIPEETMLEFPSFDIGVVGEGEETLHELCIALRDGGPVSDVDGIVYRSPEGVKSTPPRLRILDQDSLPFPAWDMMPPAEVYYVQTVRGCPFDCKFCMNPNGKVARKRSPEKVVEELNHLIDTYKVRRIYFGDELFSVDMARTHDLLDLMIEHGIGEKVEWIVQTHVRYVDYDLLEKFKEANVTEIDLGIETGDEAIMKKMGKGISLKQIKDAYGNARKVGVKIGTFFLIGQPNETTETIRKTVKLAAEINPHLPMFGLMTPYPGTEVSRLAAKNEAGYRLISTDWDEYNKQIGGALAFANLSRRQIEFYQIYAYLYVFLRNFRILDLAKFLWQYRVGVLAVFKKVTGSRTLSELKVRPPDYEEMLSGDHIIEPAVFVDARDAWKRTQTEELKRTKKISPELLNL